MMMLAVIYLSINHYTLSSNDHEFYIVYLLTTNYKAHLVINFMLEDEHRLSLGMLMHLKCIYVLCSLLCHIPS